MDNIKAKNIPSPNKLKKVYTKLLFGNKICCKIFTIAIYIQK